MHLIEPKEMDFEGKVYILSKFPAIAGREIVSQYVASGMPKVGDYKRNQELMIKLMGFVAVPIPEREPMRLTTEALIDNHVTSWETLAKIEIAMMEYNCSFFRDGRASTFLEGIALKAKELILKILTDSSVQLSQTAKPPSTN